MTPKAWRSAGGAVRARAGGGEALFDSLERGGIALALVDRALHQALLTRRALAADEEHGGHDDDDDQQGQERHETLHRVGD
ncbi:hypothetical protein [Vannielia litorea]|uniref:hypothetical protein n=1 Tax=Vannielia litorea TaxID=1217970 RepID=UPI0009418672|nr:hypothetical protein [Vannielia litorea]